MRNAPLRKTIEDINDASKAVSRTAVYEDLCQGLLLIVVKSLPSDVDISGAVLCRDTRVSLLTVTMPEGGTAILGFTDPDALQAYSVEYGYIAMQSKDVLKIVVDEGYDALILNAAGPWVSVSRQEIINILHEPF